MSCQSLQRRSLAIGKLDLDFCSVSKHLNPTFSIIISFPYKKSSPKLIKFRMLWMWNKEMEFPINWIRLCNEIWAFFLEAYSFTLQQKKKNSFQPKKSVFEFVNVPCSGIEKVCQSVTYRLALTGSTCCPLQTQWVRRRFAFKKRCRSKTMTIHARGKWWFV